MDWITDRIAIGTFVEARDTSLRASEGVRSILCLDRECAPGEIEPGAQVRVETCHLDDGPGNDVRRLRLAVELLEQLSIESPRVLVHCRAGRSRSVIVVAAYLVRTKGADPEGALDEVSRRRAACVTGALVDLLDEFAASNR
ncbi:MAG: dual specificity protein phosphatase family protein [Planctomycetes bacterium]|nr:dual specificity protein phosphatase family protein [Planctomycetota bacterium]